MTKLSVNINKFATIRNSRGGNNPNIEKVAIDVQSFGADGVTVHPRPDERHITYKDVFDIKKTIITEFNIEGNPQEDKFVQLVLATVPHQVTLVPDVIGQLTSNHGWDTIANHAYLKHIISIFKKAGIRVSIFVDPIVEMIEGAALVSADRVELYTEGYAVAYKILESTKNDPAKAEVHFKNKQIIQSYFEAASCAKELNIGLNAGHDLDLQNLQFFSKNIPWLDEVSIGHALVCDALYFGLENTIQMYKRQLNH